jgi:hypothetical protein
MPSNNDIINEADFYPGCYARATVRPFWYDTAGNKGVAFGLQNIQKLADGEPLGGRVVASKEFEPVAPAGGIRDLTRRRRPRISLDNPYTR